MGTSPISIVLPPVLWDLDGVLWMMWCSWPDFTSAQNVMRSSKLHPVYLVLIMEFFFFSFSKTSAFKINIAVLFYGILILCLYY